MSEEWAVKDGKLANTFVYIKDGTLADGKKIGDFTWAAAIVARDARSERLPLQAARLWGCCETVDQHYEQRSDDAQCTHHPGFEVLTGISRSPTVRAAHA